MRETRTQLSPRGRTARSSNRHRLAEVIQGLWAANGSGKNTGSTLYKQTNLAVQDNAWFGVRGGGRTVNVLWVYPNRDYSWFNLLSPSVQALLNPFSDPTTFNHFPHYGTFFTDLTAQEINLLASYTAWMVANPGNAKQFLSMYGRGCSSLRTRRERVRIPDGPERRPRRVVVGLHLPRARVRHRQPHLDVGQPAGEEPRSAG